MLPNLIELKKNKDYIDLQIKELFNFKLQSLVNEFNKNNIHFKLNIIKYETGDFQNNFDCYYINNVNKEDILEAKSINKLILNRKKLNYTEEFKIMYKELLNFFKEGIDIFDNLTFDSRIPILYETISIEGFEKSLKNDDFLKILASTYKHTYKLNELIREESRYLINDNEIFYKFYLEDGSYTIKKYKITNNNLNNKFDTLNVYDFMENYIKKMIVKSNIFDGNSKQNDLDFNFIKELNNNKYDFNLINNFIRNELKISPEASLLIINVILDINKNPLEITNPDDKFKLLNVLRFFSGYQEINGSIFNNENTLENNINEFLKSMSNTYNKQKFYSLRKILSFFNDNFNCFEKIRFLQENLKNKKITFKLTNNITKEFYEETFNNLDDFIDNNSTKSIEKETSFFER